MAANEIPEEFKWICELTKAQLQTLFVECRNQHKALQGRLKLAEGLAEAAARVIAMPLEDHGQCVPMHLVGLGLALADWRKAKGE